MFWSEHDYYALQKLWMRKYENGRLVEEHEIYTEFDFRLTHHFIIFADPLHIYSNQRDAEPQIEGYGTYIDEMGRRFEGDFVEFQMCGDLLSTFLETVQYLYICSVSFSSGTERVDLRIQMVE